MDNITHTLTGLMLSRAGLNRFARPAMVMMLAANVPDLDVVSLVGGPVTYLHFHRWYTHAILMLPVMASLPVLLLCALQRSSKGWKMAYLASMVGVASHLLLDWTNDYGIRLLLPFSSAWLRLDATNVVDVWIWAFLGLAFVGPLLGRLVSSEIGAKPGSGKAAAILALTAVLLYDCGRVWLHRGAIDQLEARVYNGHPPELSAAFPAGVANPAAWTGWVRTADASLRFDMHLLSKFDPESGTLFYTTPLSPAMQAAAKTDTFRRYLNFSQYPLWRMTPAPDPEGAVRVDVRDWRFNIGATALVLPDGRVASTSVHF